MQGELICFGTKLILSCGCRLRNKKQESVMKIQEKNGHTDVVTDHDIWVQEYMKKEILYAYPTHGFLGEESFENIITGEAWDWIIDPIDGTTNYIFLGKKYAISMALLYRGTIQYGWVYDVMADRLYRGECTDMVCLSDADPSQTILYMGYKTMSDLNKLSGEGTSLSLCKNFAGVRYEGCASLELCAVGESYNKAYISSHLRLWDFAAAVAILSGNGCMVMAAKTGEGEKESSIYFVCGFSSAKVWNCFRNYLPQDILKKMKPAFKSKK